MGLDMYLRKHTYIGNEYRAADRRATVTVPDDADVRSKATIQTERISSVAERVAYWRKANAIHLWMVKNVQKGGDNCLEHRVSAEKLTELMEACREVIRDSELVKARVCVSITSYKNGKPRKVMADGRKIKDPSTAMRLLPTGEGFFFGGTDYGDCYLEDIAYTAQVIEALLKEDPSGNYCYQSSW